MVVDVDGEEGSKTGKDLKLVFRLRGDNDHTPRKKVGPGALFQKN